MFARAMRCVLMMVSKITLKLYLKKNEIKISIVFTCRARSLNANHKNQHKKLTTTNENHNNIVRWKSASWLVDFHISSTKHVLALSCSKDRLVCTPLDLFNYWFYIFYYFPRRMKGREQPTSELVPILARLSKHHAEAVKLRVKALNRTVRGRTRSRNTRKKPDIRDVFRDVEVR